MRAVLAIVLAGLLWISQAGGASAQLAKNADCSTSLTSSPAHIVCFDGELTVLASETTSVYRRALATLQGAPRSRLVDEQAAWEASLATRCDLWRWVSPDYALTARPCLTREYVARISKLGKEVTPQNERLQSRQGTRSARRYFTILSRYENPTDAINALAQARYSYPYESFELYPPRGVNAQWLLSFASYVPVGTATRARDLARALAISALPDVWLVPEALVEDTDWNPCIISTDAARTIVCNGKTYDALLSDKATASSMLSGRLNDQPSEVTLRHPISRSFGLPRAAARSMVC